jgi:hypothetical protein
MFGSNGYAKLMGRLAMPSLIAQAAAPSLGARFGAYGTLATLSGLALINVALACGLGWLVCSRRGLQIQPQINLGCLRAMCWIDKRGVPLAFH